MPHRANDDDAARILAALDDVHFDVRNFIDAQHAVVVEIGLLDPSLVDGDLVVKSSRELEDQPALQLRYDRIGIDRDAGIDRRGHTAQINLAFLVDLRLDDRGDETAERRLDADAAANARRQGCAPA